MSQCEECDEFGCCLGKSDYCKELDCCDELGCGCIEEPEAEAISKAKQYAETITVCPSCKDTDIDAKSIEKGGSEVLIFHSKRKDGRNQSEWCCRIKVKEKFK